MNKDRLPTLDKRTYKIGEFAEGTADIETRAAALKPESFDSEARTVDVKWTTGATVRRRSFFGDYDVTLGTEAANVRLDRLNSSAPFLNAHSANALSDVIGVVVPGSARMVDGEGFATVKLSDTESDADVVRKIETGLIRNVSVGFNIHTRVVTEKDDGPDQHFVSDWEPFEISAVPMGADSGAHIRSLDRSKSQEMDDTKKIAAEAEAKRADVAKATEAAAVAAVAADGTRRSEIRALATTHGIDVDTYGAWLDDPACGVDTARAHVLTALADRDDSTATRSHFSIDMGTGDGEKRATAIRSAILHRSDPGLYAGDYDKHGASDFRGMSLLDIARHCLESTGVTTRGLSRREIAGMAFSMRSEGFERKRIGLASARRIGPALTVSDFPLIMAEVANASLRRGLMEVGETYTQWAQSRPASDFRANHELAFGEAPNLAKVNESGEFKRGTIVEGDETWNLSTFGLILAFTRQALISDKIGALTQAPFKLGQSVQRNRSDVVYDLINDNGNMRDGVAYFHANHGNLEAATVGAPNKARLAAMRLLGRSKTDIGGIAKINARMTAILAPAALETDVDDIISQFVPVTASTGMPAAFRSLTPIIEPRLDDGSAVAWYTVAGGFDSLVYGTLDGEGVFTETRAGFDVDGVEIKIRDDFGAGLIATEGLYKNNGV